MRKVEISDDPRLTWLSPDMLAMALAALRWSIPHLSRQAGVDTNAVREFIECGAVSLSTVEMGRILRLVLQKVEFTTAEAEVGVVRKPSVSRSQGPGYIEFGGPLRRRPPL